MCQKMKKDCPFVAAPFLCGPLFGICSAKFDRGHRLRGRQMQVGWVKIGNIRQITGYISKTVQDRRMVSLLKSNRKSYAQAAMFGRTC